MSSTRGSLPSVVTRRTALAALSALPLTYALAALPRTVVAAPAWGDRPTGTLVVARRRDLVLVQADGSGERTVLSLGDADGAFIDSGAWSPDGNRIAFVRYLSLPPEGPPGTDLVVISVREEGSPLDILVSRSQASVLLATPAWMPDGSGLIFVSVERSATRGFVERVDWVGVDGSARRTLVEDGRDPTISPDGSAVAYVKTLPDGDSLWVRLLADGPARQVVAESDLMSVAFPRFSPDGTQLAFAGAGDVSRFPAMKVELHEPSFDGNVGAAVSTGAFGPQPVLHRRHGIPWDLFLVDSSGTRLRRLAILAEDDAAIAWSPDGVWIAVGGATGLRLVSTADGSVRYVTSLGNSGAIDWR